MIGRRLEDMLFEPHIRPFYIHDDLFQPGTPAQSVIGRRLEDMLFEPHARPLYIHDDLFQPGTSVQSVIGQTRGHVV